MHRPIRRSGYPQKTLLRFGPSLSFQRKCPTLKTPDHVWGRDLQHASSAESQCTARMAVEGAIVSGRVTVAAQGTGCCGFGPYHLTRIVMGLSTMAISRLSSAVKKANTLIKKPILFQDSFNLIFQ
jgi:hypothetical protein